MVSESILSIVVYPVLFIFPAYAANGIPVLLGGGAPLDFKRKFNGKRILGDNKTIRGTFFALAAGIIAGLIETYSLPGLGLLPAFVAMTFGAVFGDLLGSFLKRQLNFKSGSSFPVMDQYGFFLFALIFAYPFTINFPDVYGLIFITILTGAVHVLTNIGAYKLKLKKVPW